MAQATHFQLMAPGHTLGVIKAYWNCGWSESISNKVCGLGPLTETVWSGVVESELTTAAMLLAGGFCLRGFFGGLGPIGFVCLHTTSVGYWCCRPSGGSKGRGGFKPPPLQKKYFYRILPPPPSLKS